MVELRGGRIAKSLSKRDDGSPEVKVVKSRLRRVARSWATEKPFCGVAKLVIPAFSSRRRWHSHQKRCHPSVACSGVGAVSMADVIAMTTLAKVGKRAGSSVGISSRNRGMSRGVAF